MISDKFKTIAFSLNYFPTGNGVDVRISVEQRSSPLQRRRSRPRRFGGKRRPRRLAQERGRSLELDRSESTDGSAEPAGLRQCQETRLQSQQGLRIRLSGEISVLK